MTRAEKVQDVKRRIEEFRNQRRIYIDLPKKKMGGQQCGMPVYPTVVEHEDLGIKISIKAHHSNHKNKDLALALFDMAFDELVF